MKVMLVADIKKKKKVVGGVKTGNAEISGLEFLCCKQTNKKQMKGNKTKRKG